MTGARCSLVAVVVLVVVAVLGVGTSAQSISALANGNIDKFLQDPKYIRKQIACVLDRGQCDRLGGQLKRKYNSMFF